MPQTVNGVGTHYAGRDNVHISTDTCDSCGAYTNLESYDTTLYFVLVFIPIFPVGRKRILNQCPACTYHYAIPLKDWESKKTEGLAKAAEGFRANPGSEEHAIDALGAVIAFQDEEEFDRLATVLNEQMAQNPGVMSELARGYAYFRKPDDAINLLFRTKGMVDDNDDLNEQLAFLLIDQKRPDEAAPLVRHIFDKKKEEDIGLLMLLVESFQAVGDHKSALEVLGELKEAFPDKADNKHVKKAEKVSKKHAESGKKIPSKHLGSASPLGKGQGTNMSGATAKWVSRFAMLSIALVLTGILYFLLSNASGPQEVHVVNGLKIGYEVDINGQKVKVGPGHRTTIEMKEGPVTVKFISGVKAPDQAGEMHTSYWRRMFGSGFRVINPDGCAALLWEESEYSDRPMNQKEYKFEIHAGKLVHTFDDIDHKFENFPNEIQSESSRVMRTRISLWQAEPLVIWGAIGKTTSLEDAAKYARQLVTMDPTQTTMLSVMMQSEKPEVMIEILKSRLGDRPVLIDWHRMYQELAERRDIDIVAEYTEILKKEPDNEALLYLRGRAEADQEQALEFYQKSMKGKSIGSAYAANALAYQKLAMGEFGDALQLTSKILSGRFKDNVSFRSAHLHALLANRRYADVVQLCREAEGFDVFNNQDLKIHATFRHQGTGGTKVFCRHEIDQMKKRKVEKKQIDAAAHQMEAQVKHAAGDAKGYADELAKADQEHNAFEIALYRGDIKTALGDLKKNQFADSGNCLLVFIAALQQKKSVEECRKFACETLANGSKEEKLMAEWLSGKEKPDYKRAVSFIIDPSKKAIFFAALAMDAKSEKNQRKLLDLAAKFNFNPTFPHLFLKQATEKDK